MEDTSDNVSSDMDDSSSDSDLSYGDIDSVSFQSSELHPYCCGQSKKDFKRMKLKLESSPFSLNEPQESEDQDLPLQVAIYCKHIKCVQFLLHEGANVDKKNRELKTPLGLAVERKCASSCYRDDLNYNIIIKMLLNKGADINYKGLEYQSTKYLSQLMQNYNDDYYDIIKLFLNYGADTEDFNAIDVGELYYVTPLYEAFIKGYIKLCKLFFTFKAEINIHRFSFASYYIRVHKPLLHSLIDTFECENHECNKNMLHLYWQFGGDMNVVNHSKTPHMSALQYLHSLPNKDWHGIDTLLNEYATNPLTLMSLCRLKVRDCMNKEFRNNISSLDLPKEVKQFLKFK